MFKVHLPAKSFFKKQVRTFGSAELLDAYLSTQLLRKAGLLHYREGGEDDLGAIHTWPSADIVDLDSEDPWANQDKDKDGLLRHRPPWSHNAHNGDWLNNDDGTPLGDHPIDYIRKDIMARLRDKGYQNVTDGYAKSLLQRAIDKYNTKHPEDSNNLLPSEDSVHWRRLYFGDHYGPDVPVTQRIVRGRNPPFEGAPRNFLTYSLNKGNIDHPGADKGRWIDGGFIHMHDELGEVLKEENEKAIEAGKSPLFDDVDDLPYTRYSVLYPQFLTNRQGVFGPHGIVTAWNKAQTKEAGLTGSIPEQYRNPQHEAQMAQERVFGEVHADQVSHILPDSYYHAETSNVGGRPKRLKEGESPESRRPKAEQRMHDLRNYLEQSGISHDKYSDEDLKAVAGTRAARLLFARTQSQDNKGGGAVKGLTIDTFNDLGSHHSDGDYQTHLTHATAGANKAKAVGDYASTANRRAAEMVAHLSHIAYKKVAEQGLSEKEAAAEATREFREHESQRGRFAHQEGLRELTEQVIQDIMGKAQREPFSLQNVMAAGTKRIESGLPAGYGEAVSEIPEWAQAHHITDPAPQGNTVGVEPTPQAQIRDIAPQAPAPMAAPGLQAPYGPGPGGSFVRPAVPAESMFGAPGDPAQRFWDIGSTALVQRSEDVIQSLGDIRKKMEALQYQDARNDIEVQKMLPDENVSLSSYWDVQDMARNLGITGVDVHGLYQSQGDWHKVAKQWNVNPNVVKVVKVAFGGE